MLNTSNIHSEKELRNYQNGKMLLLNDLTHEPFLKWQIILGVMSTDQPNSINPSNAEAFLDVYFNAYLGERRAFSGDPEDPGRMSWLSYMWNQISSNYHKNPAEISSESKDIIFEAFKRFLESYVMRKMEPSKLPPSDWLELRTKNSIQDIIE